MARTTKTQCNRKVIHRNRWMLPPNTSVVPCSYAAVGRWVGETLCRRHLNATLTARVDAQYKALDRRIGELRVAGASTDTVDAAFAARDAFNYDATLAACRAQVEEIA